MYSFYYFNLYICLHLYIRLYEETKTFDFGAGDRPTSSGNDNCYLAEFFFPSKPTAAVQIVHAGPYEITLNVNPNPPRATQPATLSLQIAQTDTHQLVSGAHVALSISMLTMDMGTEALTAQAKSPGIYEAQAQFPMGEPGKYILL